MAFSESFQTAAGFYDRFDHGWSGFDPWTIFTREWDPPIKQWTGDHDMSCGGADTQRPVNLTADKAEMIWWCAPGNDASRGHVMTSVNTGGYNIVWFSPKQTFTNVRRVCWDQNLTDLGGGKWVQVALIPADLDHGDLGYVAPNFADLNGPTTGLYSPRTQGVTGVVNGHMTYFQDGHVHTFQDLGPGIGFPWDWGDEVMDWDNLADPYRNDRATRVQHCLEDQGNGFVRMSFTAPNGTVVSEDTEGSFQDGPVRVVFMDDSYNPDKHGGNDRAGELGAARYTWHWDNVSVE